MPLYYAIFIDTPLTRHCHYAISYKHAAITLPHYAAITSDAASRHYFADAADYYYWCRHWYWLLIIIIAATLRHYASIITPLNIDYIIAAIIDYATRLLLLRHYAIIDARHCHYYAITPYAIDIITLTLRHAITLRHISHYIAIATPRHWLRHYWCAITPLRRCRHAATPLRDIDIIIDTLILRHYHYYYYYAIIDDYAAIIHITPLRAPPHCHYATLPRHCRHYIADIDIIE